ncbi:hypothetical protein DYB37_012966 [Aphanomyces astaci]|uniref:Uncharacterized protein n=1 Tax=Aphanomyces astaci TaxID=112090 RepID=A0A3R6WEU8_APHAT|nr:hypothetical protein DYB35_009147 [Aphanomyces astaci]RHZ33074.1 hypothetical protein DYB37_012966 [Aphanomyces astaci]
MDDVAARQRRKREYIRTFMQEYRGKQRQDKETLQAQIDRLEARVARYRKNTVLDDDSGSGMLPWKDVAAGLHDSRSEASKDQRALSSRIKEYEQVLSELRSFVVASIAPQSMTLYNSMDVVFHEEGHHFLQTAHLTWECSLETAVRLYRHQTGSMFTLDGFCPMHSQSRVEVEENTTLHQYKRPNGWNTHLLCGEIELRRVSATVTRERYLCVISHEIEQDGTAVGLEETSKRWGMMSLAHIKDDDQRERVFRMGYRARNVALKHQRKKWYEDMVAAAEDEQSRHRGNMGEA